jgi:cytochrome c biogenesis protein CcmG, thiol:disulfide interchange protein DsbE
MAGRRSRWVAVLAVLAVLVGVCAVAALLTFGLTNRAALGSAPLQPRPAPDFALPALDADEHGVKLSDLRGRVVVVNFWASWCAECRTEQAALNQTWQRFRDAGAVVVGVNFEDAPGDAAQYVAEAGISYPVVVDEKSATALAYGLRGVPETYVVDRTGRMVERFVGPVDSDRLSDTVTDLLAGATR